MRWNTPLSEDHAAVLLQRLDIRPGANVLDLGCGWGELLLRAVAGGDVAGRGGASNDLAKRGVTTGVGVDTDEAALARGRRLASERSLDARVTFVEGDASEWKEPADRVLCVGSSHAFGGSVGALAALAEVVRPGGRLLLGDGCWEGAPTAEATEIFGDEVLPLADLVEQARLAGWRVLHFSTASQREWDDFESSSRAGWHEWLSAHQADPRSPDVREHLDTRLREYVGCYRGLLGFGYFLLGH
jgi:cyclopropane fatty-acyl-phospholipid synthase-like methyltransferase